jgi:hypothetical protein
MRAGRRRTGVPVDGLVMEGIYVGVDVYAIRESPKIELEIFAALNQADAAMRKCRNK